VVNPRVVDLNSDINALFGTICGEAESETIAGKRAVGASIMGEVLRIASGFPRLNFAP